MIEELLKLVGPAILFISVPTILVAIGTLIDFKGTLRRKDNV